jgi:hypothetical protein
MHSHSTANDGREPSNGKIKDPLQELISDWLKM